MKYFLINVMVFEDCVCEPSHNSNLKIETFKTIPASLSIQTNDLIKRLNLYVQILVNVTVCISIFEANLEIEEHKTKSKVLRVEDRKVD